MNSTMFSVYVMSRKKKKGVLDFLLVFEKVIVVFEKKKFYYLKRFKLFSRFFEIELRNVTLALMLCVCHVKNERFGKAF